MPHTVLFLHPSVSGYGADLQLYALASGLDPPRYRPLVVLPEKSGELATRLEDAGIETYYAPLPVLRRGLLTGHGLTANVAHLARARRELGRLARDRTAAIVHTNTSIVLGGQQIAAAARAAHVTHVREIYDGAGGRLGSALWPLFRRRLLRADALPCVSAAVAAQFDGSERAFVLRNGIVRVPRPVARDNARAALGLPAEPFVVAVVGRLSDWKGQDILARALVEPCLSELGAVGLIAGDAAPGQEHHERALLELRDELRLGDRLRLLGFRRDIEIVLGAADVVAVPSKHPDALPNAALEAASAGLPLVATACGGIPEIVHDGRTGRLIPPGDAPALAAALAELAEDPATARRLGEAAAADVAGRFEVSRTLDELQACYERVLGARERRATAGAHPGTRTGGNAAAGRGAAWMLPAEVVPASTPAASELRFGRIQRWLAGIGYTPEAFAPGKPSLPTGAKPMRRSRGTARAFAGALQRVLLTPWWGLRALRERPAVVLTNTALNAPAIALIKHLLRDRVLALVDVAGIRSLEIAQTTRRPAARALYRPIWCRLERLSFSSADLVLAVNEAHARLITERHGHVNVQVLRDAAEPDLAKLPPRDRTELGLPRDAVAVCFVGALICSRLEPLFDAWGEIAHDRHGAEAGPRLCLVVIGDGPDLRKHERRASTAGWLGSSVFFLGALPRDAAMSAARACDIAYSDCWSHAGFPFKLYEYMALGLPILVHGKAQMSEVLSDERDALFFESQRELTSQISRLAGDPRLRERLGSAARATFLAGHTLPERRREFEALVTGTVGCVE